MRVSVRIAAVAFWSLASLPQATTAQALDSLAARCAAAGGDGATCASAAVAAHAVVSQVSLLAGLGSELPGEGSTLGRRLGGKPRFAVWLRGGGLQLAVPDPTDPNGATEASGSATELQTGLALGIFDGFRVLPTMGGFLSLDVFGQASFLFLPNGKGFDGNVNVYSVGARVGVLQESFTLPGVSVSASRRFSGDVRLGDAASGDPSDVWVDPAVTSIRATVSKDFFAFGLLAGFGWDDFSSDVRLAVTDGSASSVTAAGSLDGNRTIWFGSLSRQLGILAWITLEGGWAAGFDPATGYGGAGFDPEGSTLFGSISLLFKI